MANSPTDAPWPLVTRLVAWLDAANGTGPEETAARLLKLTEEAGEVAAAYIGLVGSNPRKGITHATEDVADELCDVILAAMVVLHRFTNDPAGHLAFKAATVAERAGITTTQPSKGES